MRSIGALILGALVIVFAAAGAPGDGRGTDDMAMAQAGELQPRYRAWMRYPVALEPQQITAGLAGQTVLGLALFTSAVVGLRRKMQGAAR